MKFLNIDIRRMEDKDLSSVMEIENLCFLSPYNKDNMLYEINDNPYSNPWVIELSYEGKSIIAGFSIYWTLFDTASIIQIAIHPSLQKRNLGSALMDEIYNDCFSKKIKSITLEVRENNKNAINFYLKHGFVKKLVKPQYYTNGDNAIIMELEVDLNGKHTSN